MMEIVVDLEDRRRNERLPIEDIILHIQEDASISVPDIGKIWRFMRKELRNEHRTHNLSG